MTSVIVNVDAEIPDLDVPPVEELEEGTVFEVGNRFGIRLYDGAITVPNTCNEVDGNSILVYSESECEQLDDEGIRIRDNLRLYIGLEPI